MEYIVKATFKNAKDAERFVEVFNDIYDGLMEEYQPKLHYKKDGSVVVSYINDDIMCDYEGAIEDNIEMITDNKIEMPVFEKADSLYQSEDTLEITVEMGDGIKQTVKADAPCGMNENEFCRQFIRKHFQKYPGQTLRFTWWDKIGRHCSGLVYVPTI